MYYIVTYIHDAGLYLQVLFKTHTPTPKFTLLFYFYFYLVVLSSHKNGEMSCSFGSIFIGCLECECSY